MTCDTIKIETLDADEVVSIVTAGPQGPSGSEAATLTTTGDMLYRAALANDRLPIGSEGQVLKVSSGLPAWGNESGAVTSVNGETGAVVLDASDIGAQGAMLIDPTVILGATTLTAARAKEYRCVSSGTPYAITLPVADNQEGDLIVVRCVGFNGNITVGGSALLSASGQQVSLRYNDGVWQLLTIDNHTHPATDITSGTLAHERGGLEANVSAYNGLVKISGGSTSAVGIGTGSTEVAAGDHTHAQLHDRSHAITSTSDHTAGNHKVFYSDGSGQIQELALGNSGEVLTSNGASAAPSFAAKPVELVVACSDETTDLTTGTAKVTFRAPYAFLLTGVRASVNTAPTGSTLIVDINNGVNSALSTKLSIDANEKTSTTAATAAVIDTTYDDFSDDAEITIDIDQIGSTVAGKGLKVTLIGTRA